MKYLIASDLHGSQYYAQKLIERFVCEGADKIIILGDIYNHGPRNSLPKDYAPMEVAKILNGIKDKLLVIKGNCDSEVDTMISDFDFLDNVCLLFEEKTLFLTHGHVYNKDNMPKTQFNAVIYGHFHTGFIERTGDAIVVNTGSLSLPKNQTPNSYVTLEGGEIILKDIVGKVIDKVLL